MQDGQQKSNYRVIRVVPGKAGLLPFLGLLCDEGALEGLVLGRPVVNQAGNFSSAIWFENKECSSCSIPMSINAPHVTARSESPALTDTEGKGETIL